MELPEDPLVGLVTEQQRLDLCRRLADNFAALCFHREVRHVSQL